MNKDQAVRILDSADKFIIRSMSSIPMYDDVDISFGYDVVAFCYREIREIVAIS